MDRILTGPFGPFAFECLIEGCYTGADPWKSYNLSRKNSGIHYYKKSRDLLSNYKSDPNQTNHIFECKTTTEIRAHFLESKLAFLREEAVDSDERGRKS